MSSGFFRGPWVPWVLWVRFLGFCGFLLGESLENREGESRKKNTPEKDKNTYTNIYIYTWNPNDPYFDWKRPCFGGLTFKNRGHLGSRYILKLLKGGGPDPKLPSTWLYPLKVRQSREGKRSFNPCYQERSRYMYIIYKIKYKIYIYINTYIYICMYEFLPKYLLFP